MLDAALGLAQLVKEQTDMTWENTEQVQRYIDKLRQHVDKLARQNNKLATYHKLVREKVVSLMSIDLLRQQMRWKETLKEIRQIITQVEQDGFTNLKTWRNHWDRQLYKALEHQYQVRYDSIMTKKEVSKFHFPITMYSTHIFSCIDHILKLSNSKPIRQFVHSLMVARALPLMEAVV